MPRPKMRPKATANQTFDMISFQPLREQLG